MSIVDNPPVFIALNATLFFLGYFIPSFMALTRQRDQRMKVFLLNLLAGWTIVGWMLAFIWAAVLPPAAGKVQRVAPPPSDGGGGA